MKNSQFFLLMCLIFVGMICFAFLPCFSAGFLNWDDPDHLLKNPFLPFHGSKDIISLFITPTSAGESQKLFAPLTIFSFGVERFFFGLNPFVFHLDNILLHIASSFLVLALGCRMGISKKSAFLAALVFAVHPMKVESVAWVTERKDVLFGVFYLGALVLYWDYIKHSQGIRYVFALVCAGLSILAKPTAASLPLVLVLLDWMAHRRWTMRSLWDKLPFVLALWPIAAITMILHSETVAWKNPEALLIMVFSAAFYIIKFLFPFDLSPIHLMPKPISLQNPSYAASLMILAIIFLTGYLFRQRRWVLFALLFYVLTIFFLWRLDSLGDVIVYERYMYIPSLGFSLLIGKALDHFFLTINSGQRKVWIAGLFLCTLLATASFRQCYVWQDSFVFWTEILRHYPDDPRPFYNRAECLLSDPVIAQRYSFSTRECSELATHDLYRVIQIKGNHWRAWNNLGHALKRLGQAKEAEEAFVKARYLRKVAGGSR